MDEYLYPMYIFRHLRISFALALFIQFAANLTFGQGAPFCPSINAQFGTGPSTTICQGQCANLSASVVPVNQTTSYSVTTIPYAPFSFTNGTSIIANQDDIWSSVLNLGFPFCYYGNTFTQGVVGSNGQLTFSLGVANQTNGWSITTPIPSLVDMPGNTICAAFRDIDPTSSGNIYFATYGTAPCRSFVISWNNVPMFSNPGSCSGIPNSTFQLVLHETSNYIDVFIQNSTACPGWNSGRGIIGVQNVNGTLATFPAGRNSPTQWTATNEAWRFVPTGPQSYTVNWAGPSGNVGTGLTANVCPATTTNYTATMNITSCTGVNSSYTSAVTVSVVPSPTLTVNSATVCQGTPATLTVSGGTSYTWQPGNITGSSVTFTPAATTIYTVTGSPGGPGCLGTATTNINVNGAAVAIPGSNSPICAGNTLSLTVGAALNYTWTGPNGFSSNLQNPTITNVTTNASGTYTIFMSSGGTCTAIATTSVTIFPLPNPVAANNGPLCDGATLNLTGGGSITYTWTGPNGFSSTNQNPSLTNVNSLAAGVYTLMVGAGSCSASTTTSLTVNPLPSPTIVSNSPVCEGQTINLTGSGGTSYLWVGPGSFNSNAQNPSIASASMIHNGTFTLTVTDANNCSNSTTHAYVVNSLPVVSTTGSSICVNQTMNLSANGGVTYSWSGPNGFTSNLQNPSVTNAQTNMAGVYNVTVTNANSCVNTGMATVLINPEPTPIANSNSPICVNSILSLNGSGGVNYSWSGPNGFSSSAQNPTLVATSAGMSGSYMLTVSDAIGCSSSTAITVVINPIPSISITSANINGCAPVCTQFSAQTSSGVQSVNWNSGGGQSASGNNVDFCYSQAGNYLITAQAVDNAGCINTSTYAINVVPKPIADFNYAPYYPTVNTDGTVKFTDASHTGTITAWNWYFMNTAQYTSTQQHPEFTFTEAGSYEVVLVVKNNIGCSDTIIKTIVVGEDYGIYVPNAFTPNKDGLNDFFQPKGFGIKKYQLEIFDRWGERIFVSKEFENGWDGKRHRGIDYGTYCPDGVYVWRITLTNVKGESKELKGHVTLIK